MQKTFFMAMAGAAALAMSGAAADPQALADPNFAPDPNGETLQLDVEHFQRVTVPVQIGGTGPYRFLVDTGAQATVISRELADELSLNDRGQATLIGMASRRPVEVAMIPGFSLGRRTMTIRQAPLVDRQNIGGAHGILGLDSLQDQRVVIDFVKEEIHVTDVTDKRKNSGYEIVVQAQPKLGQLIITDARVNGIETTVIIDTGSQGTIGNPALLETLRRTRQIGQTDLIDINGVRMSTDVYKAGKLTVGQMQLRNFPILFADSPPFHALGLSDTPALVLGVNELSVFRRVAIDFKDRKVMFDLPRGLGFGNLRSTTVGGF
ncbi:aspartyl protease family protein [Paraurantiacibacter namhicola]|uniref:Retroviral aspartyl protease n=1 Tax=Paraurantiacibacter namhicola TaxID=645517 RepID=A0A1C7D6T0_9SPHN|nr:aspartyl protease family protein [Paraurantiacibacter namhicola]ANU07196.1 Retroviral aspartyl protease [Paraurantiacibacter namhicola]